MGHWGQRKKFLLTHLSDSGSSSNGVFHHLIYLHPQSFPRGSPVSGCQDSAMVSDICWQITKMLLVLLSILHPLGLPSEPDMPGRPLLWSLTHCAHFSAAPWVQEITICPLHNFTTSLREAEDVKRNPTDPGRSHSSVNQKAFYVLELL